MNGPFKEQLMGALHSAVDNFNAGLEPNEAVTKAAEVYDFNAEQATRLVETFNTARTIYHFKTASDRSAEFPLADPAAVIPALFDDQPAVASEPDKEAAHVYDEYDMPEAHFEDGLDVDSLGVRELEMGKPAEFADTSIETQASRAYQVIHVQRDLAQTSRDEAGIAGTKAAQMLGKLAADLSRGYIENCEERYSRLMGAYKGDREFGPVVSKLAEFMPATLSETKAASDAVIDDTDFAHERTIMKEAQKWMQAEAEMLAIAGQMDKEADEFEREWLDVVLPMYPVKKADNIADMLTMELVKKAQGAGSFGASNQGSKEPEARGQDKQEENKGLFGMFAPPNIPGAVRKGVESSVERSVADTAEPMAEKAIDLTMGYDRGKIEEENVALSDRLKNVQRQIMLEDLIVNDPVLSEQPPNVVSNAYSAIMKLAPEVASNKEVMRAVLRQVVHSVAIGQYDAQSLVELEQKIKQVAGTMPAPRREER